MTVRVEVVRSGLIESVHEASLVVIESANGPTHRWGQSDIVAYARSALKPLQATAMIRTGLGLRPEQIAIGCSSHDATPTHIGVVAGTLVDAGLDASYLRCPPALPEPGDARDAYIRGGGIADSLHHECSGKHAAMLATCAYRGWPLDSYLDRDHPLQRAIEDVVEELTGDAIVATGVDGCGAPTHSVTLTGLARGFSRLASGDSHTPEGRVAAAMRSFPHLIGGEDRDITDAMRAAPGLIVKDGAEGIYGMALPDGRAAAFKIHDGGLRAAPPLLLGILRYWGVPLKATAWGMPPVLGHGQPVGTVQLHDGTLPASDS